MYFLQQVPGFRESEAPGQIHVIIFVLKEKKVSGMNIALLWFVAIMMVFIEMRMDKAKILTF